MYGPCTINGRSLGLDNLRLSTPSQFAFNKEPNEADYNVLKRDYNMDTINVR